ncbi:cytochrome P450 family protein [Deinococcus humi]|uniref:Cytochrome P450 PksS n=1 Tax=Deinococcus humi TaxID=662880 RepID=A0A7W8JT65_9DEIO|nr:cytochrome P450 [Deinococcus humi]MBB5362782.1 cytochrome P450 PksS [Deinococcus humi]GGO26266.1 polyketide biosynthesis cytochrome P450 PksS [Deinococcus humi]
MTLATADYLTAPLTTLAGTDITAGTFKANPFGFYQRLREDAPVFPVTLRIANRAQRAWLVTRYHDVLALLKDDESFVKNPRNAMTPEQLRKAPGTNLPGPFKVLQTGLLSIDGAAHDRLKVLVHQAFTPRTVERMRGLAQQAADDALDAAQRRGSADLISEFALPVPLLVIGRLLGVPDKDHKRFSAWTRALISIGDRNPLLAVPSILSFLSYMRRLVRDRRTSPQNDLISALVIAQEKQDALNDDEILSMIFLLLSAGHETTVNLIGSGALALIQHPDQLERLRSDPALIKPAVEELVRFVAPVEQSTERYAAHDLQIAGVHIPKGELVIGVLASANRDAAQFEQPNTLDLGRANNRHLGFGLGMHYCLGAPLARLEAQIALGTLVDRASNLQLAVRADRLTWRRGFVVRGLERLPVML